MAGGAVNVVSLACGLITLVLVVVALVKLEGFVATLLVFLEAALAIVGEERAGEFVARTRLATDAAVGMAGRTSLEGCATTVVVLSPHDDVAVWPDFAKELAWDGAKLFLAVGIVGLTVALPVFEA